MSPRAPEVTSRQLDCLIAVARGLSHKQIGTELGIQKDRVDDLIADLEKRLGARSGIHMILRAIEEGLIERRVPPPIPDLPKGPKTPPGIPSHP